MRACTSGGRHPRVHPGPRPTALDSAPACGARRGTAFAIARSMNKLVSFVRESAWAPYALKVVGIALALTGVAFLGSGVLDCWLSLQPAFASSAARASATVSAPREGRPRSTAIPTGSTSASAPELASARAPSAVPVVSGSAAPAASAPSAITSDGRVVLNLAGEKERRRCRESARARPTLSRAAREARRSLQARGGSHAHPRDQAALPGAAALERRCSTRSDAVSAAPGCTSCSCVARGPPR